MKSGFNKTAMIVSGLALVFFGLALWGYGLSLVLKPAQYRATARIIVNVKYTNTINESSEAFDPYFIQTDFEIIQSELVLSNVVAELKLEEVWGKRFAGGQKLTLTETLRLLKEGMELKPVRGTKMIDIGFTSHDPVEAAQVANAIASSYKDYRQKYDAKRVDEQAGEIIAVTIVERAVAPKYPLVRNFVFGASVFVLGLFPTVGGWLLLRASKRGI